jgi:CheY-like chemotaxis protein
VLVVEDEWIIRIEMVDALEEAGFQVFEADNGLKAISLLRDPDHIDVVVTDISMPVMDGIAVAEHVHQVHPHIPVVFASSWDNRKALPQPSFRLLKPYTGEQLVDMVEAVLA